MEDLFYQEFPGRSTVKTRIVLDGNAFYEIDEDCLMEKTQKGKIYQEKTIERKRDTQKRNSARNNSRRR